MRIAILGAGNVGCAIAADLSLKKHEVTLIKTSNTMHNDNFEYLIKNKGKIKISENNETKETNIKHVTTDLSEIKNAEIIMVFIQTNYHELLIKRMVDYIKDEQIIIFNPGYLSTAYMLKYNNSNITIVEAESSFIDCRILEPGFIKVSFRNVRNPLGIYPVKNKLKIKDKLEELDFPFSYLSSVIEAALHNPNLIVHTVGAIMSIPRIEKTNGDYIMYNEVFTPSVWNILEKLDNEKMDVLAALGFERISYVEECKYRNTLDDTKDAKEVFFWYASMPTVVKGPNKVNSRYITEDVSQGLVMLEALADQLKISTPICTSLIEIASAALIKDLRQEGRTPQSLGEKNIEKILNDYNNLK